MVTLTAIIRAKAGSEALIRQALLDVGTFVAAHEPGTVGYFVTQSDEDPAIFVTHERFADAAAMQTHNNGPGSKAFFATADGHIESVTIKTGTEIFALA